MKILFQDIELPQAIPFSRTRTIFSFRDGIYTPIERCKRRYERDGQQLELFFSHSDKRYEKLVAESDGLTPAGEVDRDYDLIISSLEVDPINSIKDAGMMINADWGFMDKSYFLSPEELIAKFPSIEIIGDINNLKIANDVSILSKTTIFDTREGLVIVDKGATIAPFSYIKGCCYIGKYSDVTNARISYNTIVGNHCRISGEVSNSVFNDYSYKSHDGFIGCSVIGTWVNFGAISTTSNLKNNYSNIKLQLPENLRSVDATEVVDTNEIKFGSLIGDYAKTAIGTMINCGSVIDFGSNVLDKPVKYTPALSWIDASQKYDKNRFVADTELILNRKNVDLSMNFRELVDLI